MDHNPFMCYLRQSAYQIFNLQFITVAKLHYEVAVRIILWFGVTPVLGAISKGGRIRRVENQWFREIVNKSIST